MQQNLYTDSTRPLRLSSQVPVWYIFLPCITVPYLITLGVVGIGRGLFRTVSHQYTCLRRKGWSIPATAGLLFIQCLLRAAAARMTHVGYYRLNGSTGGAAAARATTFTAVTAPSSLPSPQLSQAQDNGWRQQRAASAAPCNMIVSTLLVINSRHPRPLKTAFVDKQHVPVRTRQTGIGPHNRR